MESTPGCMGRRLDGKPWPDERYGVTRRVTCLFAYSGDLGIPSTNHDSPVKGLYRDLTEEIVGDVMPQSYHTKRRISYDLPIVDEAVIPPCEIWEKICLLSAYT